MLFPNFLTINIDDKLVESINNIIEKYKKDVKPSVVYSNVLKKNIESDRRKSFKNTFIDEKLKQLLENNLINNIIDNLKKQNSNNEYIVTIGDQEFDYIFYEENGYFDSHTDFVRINNDNQCQYTLLIGLTSEEIKIYNDGKTIIWIPIDENNRNEYNYLSNGLNNNNLDIKNELESNYGLNINNNSNYIIINKYLLDAKSKPLGIPYGFDCHYQGNSLLFKSNLIHCGELVKKKKELLMITINIIGITNDEIDPKIKLVTNDNKIYELQKSLLLNTMFINMINFNKNDKINLIDLNSLEFELFLKCLKNNNLESLSIGNRFNDILNSKHIKYSTVTKEVSFKEKLLSNTNNYIIQKFNMIFGINYIFNEINIPLKYHLIINKWLNNKDEHIIQFNNFELWMIEFQKKFELIPFQIIISNVNISEKRTKNILSSKFTNDIKFYNLDDSLISYDDDKSILVKLHETINTIYYRNKNNICISKHRQNEKVKLDSLTEKYSVFKKYNFTRFENYKNKELIEKEIIKWKDSKIKKFYFNFKNLLLFKNKTTTITYEKEYCNDGSYDVEKIESINYFNCMIDIKFCFYKNN